MSLSNLDYDRLLPMDWFASCEVDISVENTKSFYKLQQKLKKGKVVSSSPQEGRGFGKNCAVVKTIGFCYRTPRDFTRVIDDLVLLGLSETQCQSVADDFLNALAEQLNTKSPVSSV